MRRHRRETGEMSASMAAAWLAWLRREKRLWQRHAKLAASGAGVMASLSGVWQIGANSSAAVAQRQASAAAASQLPKVNEAVWRYHRWRRVT